MMGGGGNVARGRRWDIAKNKILIEILLHVYIFRSLLFCQLKIRNP